MKRALIIILSISLVIFTIVGVFFLTSFEKKQIGLGYKYYNSLEEEIILKLDPFATVGFGYGRFGDKVEISGETYAICCDFTEKDKYQTETFEDVKIYISRYSETNTNGELKFTGEPIIALACGTYNYINENEQFVQITKIEISADIGTFFQIIGNNVDVYNLTSMQWDDVENVVDFAVFIFDFIKGIFVMIINIFTDMGVFFG